MALTPAKELFRWKLRKCGKHVINLCTHMFLFSGVLAGMIAGAAQSVRANPEGGVVVGGSATITQTPSELQINQSSDRALIEWSSFNINGGETTRFIQPGASAIALNRVVNSSQLSTINGNLIANGRVIIINPNGVLIGANGNVDTAGFIATTADIDNDAFMNSAGALNFDRAGRADASVRNQGTISVGEAGLAALVAPTVRNDGVIQGNLAKVQLAAGDTFAVDFYGDGLLNLAVSAPQDGSGRTISVENTGSVYADGGKVLMTAAAASDVVDSVINSSGYVQARGLQNRNGEIVLTGAGADVKVSGKIDASGSNDGGSVKIGGDYQGQGTLAHADTVTIDDTAEIFADAGENGNGGTIVVWSDKATTTRGRFYARGGRQSGNGGLVETSSLLGLDVAGIYVDTTATNGEAGDWLLDPENITVTNSGVPYDPVAHSNNATAGTATIDVSTINSVSVGNVILAASNDITFNGTLNIAASGVGLQATAGRNVTVNAGGTLRTNNGDVSLTAGNNITINNSSTIYTRGGDISLIAGGTLSINNSKLGSSGGSITLVGPTSVSLNTVSINTSGGTTPGTIGINGSTNYSTILTQGSYETTATSGVNGGTLTITTGDTKNIKHPQNCFSVGGNSCFVADPIKELIVTILNSGKVYGETDPLYLTSGYVGNTYWTITSGSLNTGDTLTVDLARAAGENVGSYGISQTGYVLSNAANYTVSFVNGSFTITPAPLTITANSGVKTYGDTYNFTGTEFTIAPGSLKFSDNVSSLTLSSLGAAATAGGSAIYSITGSNAVGTGLGNYNITYAPGTLTVNPAILTITANSFGKTYGDLYTFLGTEFAWSGLKNSDTVTSVTLTSAGAAPTAAVNAYDIIASNAVGSNLLGNYTINYVNGTLTVTPAALTLVVDNKTKTYGDVNPLLTGTLSGVLNGDDVTASYSTAAVQYSNIGDYAITGVLGGAGLGNYVLTSNTDGNLHIDPARLIVIADPKTKVEGTVDPALTYTYTGTLFGKDAFTGALDRIPGETPAGGPYAINQGTLAVSANYDIQYIGNFLVITPAPVPPAAPNPVIPTISFDPLSRPVVSVANQAIVQDLPFESFEVLALNTDVGIRAASVAAPRSNAAAALAAIAPAAGGDDKKKGGAGQQPGSVEDELANIEPAAGGTGQGAPAAGTEAAGNAGDDIACANSFLDNVPCEGEAQ